MDKLKQNTTENAGNGHSLHPMLANGFIDREILHKAIDAWGANAQIELIEEECLELALALQKLKRKRGSEIDKYNAIIDEIADVKIMIEQAQIIFSQDEINKRVDYKMNRLRERLIEDLS
jgi:NTP pyrophosphatase (non-canonical NTP hydrolase)